MTKPVDENAKHRKTLIKSVKRHDPLAFYWVFSEPALVDYDKGATAPPQLWVRDALRAEINAALAADDPAEWRKLTDRLDARVSALLRAAQELLALRKDCEELTYPTDGY